MTDEDFKKDNWFLVFNVDDESVETHGEAIETFVYKVKSVEHFQELLRKHWDINPLGDPATDYYENIIVSIKKGALQLLREHPLEIGEIKTLSIGGIPVDPT